MKPETYLKYLKARKAAIIVTLFNVLYQIIIPGNLSLMFYGVSNFFFLIGMIIGCVLLGITFGIVYFLGLYIYEWIKKNLKK